MVKQFFKFICILYMISSGLNADEHQSSIKPDLPDLDVIFISRSPRYERLRVSYQKRQDAKVGDVNPYLSPDEKNKKRWPAEGDVVTFTAHVKNHGKSSVEAFDYLWFIDGAVVASGVSGQILPDSELTFSQRWRWQNGAHTVSFQVDPQNLIYEISQRNNCMSDRTDALSFHFHVEQTLYEYFKTIKNSWGTYSWEDWAQHHVSLMNEMFRNSKYPLTPDGVTERVRLDSITIHPDESLDKSGTHAPEDWEWDGRWGFASDYLKSDFYANNKWAIEHEWSLIHELGHQLVYRFIKLFTFRL